MTARPEEVVRLEPDTDEPSDAELRLLGDLQRALGPDPAPEGLADRAAGLLAVQRLDAELAELLEAGAAEPAGARGGSSAGVLSFQVRDGSVTLDVEVRDGTVTGQLQAAGTWQLTLQTAAADTVGSAVDAMGRFSVNRVPAGPVRLLLRREDGRAVRSDWFAVEARRPPPPPTTP